MSRQRHLHQRLVQENYGRGSINVVFLASNLASWKLTPLVQEFVARAEFDPVVLITPFLSNGEKAKRLEATRLTAYFERIRLPFVEASEPGTLNSLELLSPDLVFFTNPHNLTSKEYHRDAYERWLSAYVPYSHEVTAFDDHQMSYNQTFHNAMWRIFVPHEECAKIFRSTQVAKGSNVRVTGYPACEPLLAERIDAEPLQDAVWKPNLQRKLRLIWAPHWSDSESLPLATVYELGEGLMRLAEKYKDEVQWAFKPHPLLRYEMGRREGWPQSRVDAFYEYWDSSGHAQLHEGNYEELFVSSDAIIHDCGSFLAEYLYLNKPAMYLLNPRNNGEFYNDYGKRALRACVLGRTIVDIENFLIDLLAGRDRSRDDRTTFRKDDILRYTDPSPSRLIANQIAEQFGLSRSEQTSPKAQ